ncbi:ribosome recycling factor [Egibacter rhizosphaerae]|uniref:Ribosome-recycling factor n=1 Tax=Egibacter rhizosphaerae TaxID=1670831 RepID=A0A411YCN4_9ACTN|nr:ribosome recycling factor [Egibacter rhizosphaerae]QBI18956.1 ribosome recycling factor [Egibacter rhizosphaerae]
MSEEILNEAEKKMRQAVQHAKDEVAKIRTGRANPGLIADLPVEYYGTKTPLQQLAGVSVPEPRVLLVNPFDQSALKEIEKAITNADLGLNPNNDGKVIRVVFPELTEERRKQYVRLVRERAEEGRVAVRNVRRQAKSELGTLVNEGDLPEDEHQRLEKRLQGLTDKYVGEIDQVAQNKEQELLEV